MYLDEHELRLKSSFVPHVFLDCVLAKNFKYCNELLDEKIKQGKPEDIGFFFPEFNLFYSINEITFVLINKNALAGIYKFEVNNNCITNILQVSQ